jgi:hypothetical protein
MKTVHILGMAPNLGNAPLPGPSTEVWCSNQWVGYRHRNPRYVESPEGDKPGLWTHWFNLHPLEWIQRETKHEWKRLQDMPMRGNRPVFLQRATPAVAGSVAFERKEIQRYFSVDGKTPFRFFAFSGAWLIARAIMLGFERIELWGFEQRQEHRYAFERPCFFWWIQEARRRGIEVFVPPEVRPGEPGDPAEYNGPLYAFETHGYDSLAPVGAIRLPNVGTYGLPPSNRSVEEILAHAALETK